MSRDHATQIGIIFGNAGRLIHVADKHEFRDTRKY